MKISIVYVSISGNTEKVAGYIRDGAESVANTQVRLFNLAQPESLTGYEEYIRDSAAVIFGTPTYVANMSWQMKKWFDTDRTVKLGGKLGGVFATENSPTGGGAELAMMSMISHMLVKGMLVYSSGSEFNRPFIHIGPVVVRQDLLLREEHCKVFGQRMALKAHTLFDQYESRRKTE